MSCCGGTPGGFLTDSVIPAAARASGMRQMYRVRFEDTSYYQGGTGSDIFYENIVDAIEAMHQVGGAIEGVLATGMS